MENMDNKPKNGNKGKNIVIVVLAVLLVSAVGYIVFDKFISTDEKTPEKEQVEQTTEDEKDEKDEKKDEDFDISGTYSLTDKEINGKNLSITITIEDGNEMHVSAGDGMHAFDTSKGVYSIKSNSLTYTRVYYEYLGNGYPCLAEDDSLVGDIIEDKDALPGCGGNRSEVFIIDKENKTLTLNSKSTGYESYGKIEIPKAD